MEQVENLILSKLESCLVKMRSGRMTLAARILVANSILMGCVWYLLTVWAGQRSFLAKVQKVIDTFVWGGRVRVARVTIALPRAEGGLGLLGIEA